MSNQASSNSCNKSDLVLPGPTSYAKLVTREPGRKSVNFRILLTPARNGADVAISLESVRAISERFANTVYGSFLGKCMVFPVVDNYVKNTKSKYGLAKSMLNSSNELFFFKFSSKDGTDAMLDDGSWFIRDTLFIMKKWNPDVSLLKEDVETIIGFKLILSGELDVLPEQAFNLVEVKEIILSTNSGLIGVLPNHAPIATTVDIGNNETTILVNDAEKSGDIDPQEAQQTLEIAEAALRKAYLDQFENPIFQSRFYLCTIHVKYEWKPPRCDVLNECPNNLSSDVAKNLKNPKQAARDVVPRQEFSNSNPFDTLNSIENDDDLGMNRWNSKSAWNGSLNVMHGSYSNTPIIDKIDNLERQILDGKCHTPKISQRKGNRGM
ncbi:putative reverse transcriptase domain-containing protein [Tanacetum coccineum]